MDNQLQIFNYQGKQVRTAKFTNGIDGFIAKDVCDILEISNSRDALSRLDDDEKGVVLTDTLGGTQEMQAITESGLYSLTLGSRKPQAKPFKRWVTHEVLPSIRKHGAYLTPAKIEEVLLNPDTIIKLATQLKEEQEQRKTAQLESQYKSEVIQGLNRELSLADMRQVLNRIVRKVPNYQARWAELYRQFEMKYHMSLNRRINKSCSKLDYIEHSLDMLPELFDIASKLYEGEVNELIQEIYGVA